MIEYIEEHNQGFKILTDYYQKHGIKPTLIHIDSHTDLSAFVMKSSFKSKLADSLSSAEIKYLTVHAVTISSYITAALFFKSIKNIIYISPMSKSELTKIVIRSNPINNDLIGVEAVPVPYVTANTDGTFYSAATDENIEDIVSEPCVVSIDLDFFYSNDNRGEDIRCEITKKQANALSMNENSKIALKFGQQWNIEKCNGQYYLHLNLQSQFLHAIRNPEDVIKENAKKLYSFFKTNSDLGIQTVFICKSVKSGYVPEKLLNLILEMVHDILGLQAFSKAKFAR